MFIMMNITVNEKIRVDITISMMKNTIIVKAARKGLPPWRVRR